MSDNDIRLVRGGRYRNPTGAQLHVVEPARESEWWSKRMGGIALGDIWVVESRDAFGVTRHLATPEGLASYGYSLISEPAESEDR